MVRVAPATSPPGPQTPIGNWQLEIVNVSSSGRRRQSGPSLETSDPQHRDQLYTRTNGFSVEMYRARAAEGHTAAIFGSGQSQRFPEHSEQRRVRIDVDVELLAVNFEINHGRIVNRKS